MLTIKKITAAIGLWLLFLPMQTLAQPQTPTNKFPRLANYYLGDLNRADYDKLSRYDVLILIPETQYYFRDFFAYARAKNPNIIILPYIPSQSVNLEGLNDPDGLKRAFYNAATEQRYLHTPQGTHISLLRDILPVTNVTTDWSDVMPQVVKDKVLSTGLWDGIFYDLVESNINHYGGGNIDINNDGVRDDIADVNAQWRVGMSRLLSNTRAILGENQYLVINGDSFEGYQRFVNGRMFESFPTPWEGRGGWTDTMEKYKTLSSLHVSPKVTILNNNTRDLGGEDRYQLMRYGLTSSLLGNGYNSFDFGITSHHQIWWYDEYDVPLGRALSEAKNLNGGSGVSASIWRRDFERGVAFVNSTNSGQTITLEEEFEKLHGRQDPATNDGLITNEFSLSANDGLIVLRPLSQALDTAFSNGSFVRIFDQSGIIKRNGFFTYNNHFRGTATVHELSDTPGGIRWISADSGKIDFVDSDGVIKKTIYPYGANFHNPITFIVAPLQPLAQRAILTVPLKGGSVHLRAFSLDGTPLALSVVVDKRSTLSPSIAVLPASGNIGARIVLGATRGDKPIVKILDLQGKLLQSWGAFEGKFTSGMSVAVLRSRQNGSRILVGRAQGGTPELRIFTPQGKLTGLFYAFNKNNKAGVKVGAGDLDGDGEDEILSYSTQVFTVAKR